MGEQGGIGPVRTGKLKAFSGDGWTGEGGANSGFDKGNDANTFFLLFAADQLPNFSLRKVVPHRSEWGLFKNEEAGVDQQRRRHPPRVYFIVFRPPNHSNPPKLIAF